MPPNHCHNINLVLQIFLKCLLCVKALTSCSSASADLTSPKLPDSQLRPVPVVRIPLKSFTLGACNNVILDILTTSSEQTAIFHLWYASERMNPKRSSTSGFPKHYFSSLSFFSHLVPFQLWRIRTAPTSPTASLSAGWTPQPHVNHCSTDSRESPGTPSTLSWFLAPFQVWRSKPCLQVQPCKQWIG